MQPPPLAEITPGKLSFHVCFKFSRPRPNIKIVQSPRRFVQPVRLNPPTCIAFGVTEAGRCASLLFEANETRMPRLRNFDTEPHSSYCYEVLPDNRLESVANAHTAADLHVRPVS
jgi:hypothetical protein